MVRKKFTLYWSSLAMYEGCPQQFLWSKGWGAIDVGGGPGRKKPKPVQKSEHHAAMGTVIQAVIEDFYNEELWRLLGPEQLRERLLELSEESLNLELTKRYIDWRMSPPVDEMRQVIKDGVLGYMQTLKAHMLLGPYARAEVELLGYVNKYTPVGGRADTIIRRDEEPLKGVTIIDGKNGKKYKDNKGGWMTYTDPDQLRWYAMLFYLSYHKLPDRVGFAYFRYPAGDPVFDYDGNPTNEKEPGVVWVPFTMDDLKGLAQRASTARKAMDKEKFDANPSWRQCKFCDYETVCPQRQAQKKANRRNRKPKKDDLQLEECTVFSFGGAKFSPKE